MNRKVETSGEKLEARSWRLEARGLRLEKNFEHRTSSGIYRELGTKTLILSQ
jgi:hypothetical protein